MKMKLRIALYPRVSTHEQAVHGHSITEQTERMEKYCEAMGWEIYKVYTDAGFSGANMERPALKRMIRDIEANRIDKVLVYKLDRLSRSQKDTLTLIEDVFLANGCDFVSMTENLDTSTPFGKAMIGILAVFAQLEREQIKERMEMGRDARAKLGKFHGSDKIPLGYDYINGELVTNQFEKIQIQKVFELYSQGASPYKIEQTLNGSGLFHRHGKWNSKTVRRVLTRKTYLGYIFHKGEWYKGSHEPFITEELFDKVQELRKKAKENHAKHNRRAGKANSYLGGYLYCKHCDAKYSKITRYKVKRDGTTYLFYGCNSRMKKNTRLMKDPNCKNMYHKMEEFDERIFAEIKKLAIDESYFDQIQEEQPEDERPKVIKEEMQKLDNQLNKLMDLYTVGDMPVEIIQDKIKALNDKKVALETELYEIEKEKEALLSREETIRLANSFGDILDRNDFDEIRTLVSTLIEKVVIDNDNITIYWAFA